MPRRGSPYDAFYQRQRRALLASGPVCELRLACHGDPATSADHQPPLSEHNHIAGSGCCQLIPACTRCQKVQGSRVTNGMRLTARMAAKVKRPPVPSRRW